MKNLFLTLSIAIATSTSLFAQRPMQLRADTVTIANNSSNAELVLQNNTRDVKGFLYNKGNGKTEFRKGVVTLNDTTFLIGADTLKTKLPQPEGDNGIIALRALGSSIIAQAYSVTYASSTTTTTTLVDGSVRFAYVYLAKDDTVRGIKFSISTNGVYNADKSNKVGLYSYNNGTLTLVAQSVNDSSMWKSGAGIKAVPFTTSYVASEGPYFIGVLWNAASSTTTPTILSSSSTTSPGMDFTNSAKIVAHLTGVNDLPASADMSSLSQNGNRYWLALYK